MSQLTDALDGLVEVLNANGIHAVTDARDLVLPGAWVTVHDVSGVLAGALTVRADVALVVGDLGTRTALGQLGDLLDKAADLLTFDEPVKPMIVTPPGGQPMPALVITTET